MGGNFHITREHLRSTILDGEEGIEACQSYIMSLIHTAAMTASSMISKTQFTHEETIEAYTFAIDILKRLYSDDNVGFYAFDISYYYYCIALKYSDMNHTGKTLEALEESCRYAIIEANLKDMDYTAPMVNRMKHKKSDTFKNYKGNACNLRLKALEDKKFDFLRNEKVFKKIVSDLEQYAECV